MKPFKQTLMSGAMILALSLVFTSCDDILGEWDRPAPNPVVPTPEPEPEPEPTPTTTPTILETPLTFEAAEAGAQVTFNIFTTVATNEVQYSTDGEHWSTYTSGTPIELTNIGDKVMFRGTNATYAGPLSSIDNNSNFSCNKYCYIYGNIMSLIKAEGFETVNELTGTDNFRALFSNNLYIKNHTDASKYLVLPATKMTEYCFREMFYGCNALTTTPVLKVDCNSALGCMSKMFEECHNLTTVAAGSEITGNMGSHACQGMFQNCKELKTVPSTFLPATTLAEGCYQSMFNFCNALEKAPNLPAETLVASCYDAMFHFCKSLNEVRVKAGYTTAGNACLNMFSYCTNASTSKFYTDGTWAAWKAAFPSIDNWNFYPYTPGLLLAGKFSVSSTKKVRFSQGNLQAVIASGPTDTYNYTASSWKFAENQWDYIGNAAGNTTFAVGSTVDLFGWVGTSASYDTYGLCKQNSSDNAYYGTNSSDALKNDWGNTIGTGWRTLTDDNNDGEWRYLLEFRTTGGTVFGTASARYAHATINTDGTPVNGLILFPDGVDIAASEVTTAGDVNHQSAWGTKCTSAQWTALAAKGCVFLPAAGYREGTTVTHAGSRGYYWSSSPRSSISNRACNVEFWSSSISWNSFYRHCGHSVRLVRDVQ